MFQVRPHEAKTLNWWYARRKEIDFDPNYQRKGMIWSKKDQGLLIDSIINGFDMPKIYLADFSFGRNNLNPKRYTYAIIDGKQRLSAIFAFFEDRLRLNKDFLFVKDKKIKIANHTYTQLKQEHPLIAELFDTFNLSVMSVITNEDQKIEELFVRLNRSKALTGAEIRSAMGGPIPAIVDKLVAHPFFSDKINFATTRKSEYNIATKVLLMEEQKGLVTLKKRNLDDFTLKQKGLRESDLLHLYEQTLRVLDKMYQVFEDHDSILNSAGIIVLYYWLIRGTAEQRLSSVRLFLSDLNEKRRKPSLIKDKKVRVAISAYNDGLRSINDQASLKTSFTALTSLFKVFLTRNRL